VTLGAAAAMLGLVVLRVRRRRNQRAS
jgi:hypothetical protein